MHKILRAAACLLMLLAATFPAFAQEAHVVGETDLHEAVVQQTTADEAKRDMIRSLLRRDDVRDLAQSRGLDIVRAENAVGSLHGPELQRVAGYAAQAHTALAGGANQIVIGTTTLIIILLVIIILLLL